MLSGNGVVVYVGKSKRIRTRLLGYFRAKSEEKAWRIIREAQAVEWEYVPSEFASLVRELELIKLYRPPYNVRHKRDGLYCYLKLSRNGAPRLSVSRRIGDDAARYFGPLRGGQRIIDGVRELNDILGLRDCRNDTPVRFADQQDMFGPELAALCPRYELRRCLGPCAGRCTEREYGDQVAEAQRFLLGESDAPLLTLHARMEDAAGRMEFEHAAHVHNRIQNLEYLRSEFHRLRDSLDHLTFLYAVPGIDGEHRVYAIRAASIRAVHPLPRTPRQRRRLLATVESILRRPESPGETASRDRIEQVLLISHWFRTRPEELERTFSLEDADRLPLVRQLEKALVA